MALALGMTGVGLVFVGLVLATGLLVEWLKDTDIEKWAKLGPFAKKAENRLTEEYQNARPEEVFQHLVALVEPVSVRVLEDPGVEPAGVVVEVVALGFDPGKDVLDVRAMVEVGGSFGIYRQPLTPVAIKVWKDEGTGEVLGYRYYYQVPEFRPLSRREGALVLATGPLGGLLVLNELTKVEVRACASRITGDGMRFPPPAVGERVEEVVETIEEGMPGWAVSEPLELSRFW